MPPTASPKEIAKPIELGIGLSGINLDLAN